ncbi:D-beta-D-heptose 7-phosphate kinase/D-beta-D-heptose 1-phosphate adenosyltransferase [Geothermobacter ehrlichii]|uniref:Bifunctional protein HldE n=2 Tax=Geothermobacter ehrlichii TaxID=213224 RepID=A0A5D3WR44_9BACT|nr:D-glycero-beta-D-manno-heptose-7-phosphate kinase [Geothermobacter ehrlichii]TYP00059.1 D-beta-D-heptose 7-phosphate kinase/D-beta-D-heptose 1-phosphate adenosyltransferase [Geothermobacter ehrlichii]
MTAVEHFLAGCADLEVLVVGDLMLDHYLFGQTGRISPEAPVPVVRFLSEEFRPGGAANVALNLRRLGCRVHLAGVVGDDADGRSLRRLVEREAVCTAGIETDEGRRTTRKTRIISRNQQVLRIDREDVVPLGAEWVDLLLNRLLPMIETCRLVLCSDYGKGSLPPALLSVLVDRCRQRQVPVLIDPKGVDYTPYRGASLLTPNRSELCRAARLDPGDSDDARLFAAARRLVGELDLDGMLVTRSEEGMTHVDREGRLLHSSARVREVHDVAGAGDTVLAVVGAAVALGLEMPEAMRLANLAAGIVVGKPGVAAVSPDELKNADRPRDKRIAASRLEQIGNEARALGRRIVFTNGCFDLLHVGHVRYLQKAREFGDLLVLGLNSDASIRRLKGERRPLIGQEERAQILAALDSVDYIVVFDEDTPIELIRALRPDILVKGGDYAPEEVVGREFVESYGGRLELVTFEAGKSTTAIVEKILDTYRD